MLPLPFLPRTTAPNATVPTTSTRAITRTAPRTVTPTAILTAAALTAATLTASASMPTADASPLIPGSAMPEPMAPIITPDWSGLDVRDHVDLPSDPGILIDAVPLAENLRMPAGGETQQRIVYSTIDQHGEIAASTAAVFLPQGTAPEGGWPVIAWAHGTTGMGDNCTPSAGSRNDKDLVNQWVDAGYAVVASDYTGMGTPGLMSYFNGEATATSVVDSVIAVHDLEADLSTRWAVAGQSQGGGAALHVAHGASERSAAAGLDYRGAVATGAPGYIEEVMILAGPSSPPVPLPGTLSAYLLYTLAGFREARPDLDVDSVLTDEGRRMVDTAETTCLREFRRALDGVNIASAFSADLRSVPGLESALRAYMSTPTDGYDRPVFLGHGLLDTDVPSPIGMMVNSQLWVNQFAGSNEQVEVHWYPTDHSGVMSQSFGDAAAFMTRIMA